MPDPENKVDVVKENIEVGELFLEPHFQYVVAHCRLEEWRFDNWLVLDAFNAICYSLFEAAECIYPQ